MRSLASLMMWCCATCAHCLSPSGTRNFADETRRLQDRGSPGWLSTPAKLAKATHATVETGPKWKLKVIKNDAPEVTSERAVKPPVDDRDARAQAAAATARSGRRIPAYARRRPRPTFLDHTLAGEELDHQRPTKLLAALQELVSRRRSSTTPTEGFDARADERARLAVPAVAHRLGRPVQRSAAPPVHPARVAPAARSPEARRSTRCTSSADAPVAGAHPPLPRQGAVPAARHLPGLLPLLHAQLRGRRRHRRGREGLSSRSNDERWQQRVRVHRARAPSSRTSSSRAATRTSCAPSRSRRSARRCSTMPNIRRMRFATKGPAVMPQKILTDDAWIDALTARRRARPQAPQGGGAPHALQPPERDHRRSPKRAMNKLFERGITVRNQSVLQRGVNDTRRRR